MELKNLFNVFKVFKQKKDSGNNDALDTAARALVSKIVKGIGQLLPKKFFGKMTKHQIFMVSAFATVSGYILRKFTNFGPFGDNFITDLSQEVADQVEEIFEDEQKKKGETVKLTTEAEKAQMIKIAKLLINAQTNFTGGVDFFVEFNNMMAKMNETNQIAFVDMLSKFNNKEMGRFMSLTTEEKEKFFSYFFSDNTVEAPSPEDVKSLGDWLRETKSSIMSGVDETIEVVKEISNRFGDNFKPGTSAYKFAERLEAFSKKF